jgi:hypothetical protein
MPYHVGKKGSYGCSGFPALKEDGTVMGCHKTAKEAAGQIYAINRSEGKIGKAMVSIGDFVIASCDDEIYIGRVEHVMAEGSVGIEGSEYYMEATAESPAVVVRTLEFESDGGYWEETKYLVNVSADEVVVIEPLPLDAEAMLVDGELVPEMMDKVDGCCPEESLTKADPCWEGYTQRGMKPGKNGRMVPNCVPVEKSEDLYEDEDDVEYDDEEMSKAETFTPNAGMKAAARRALKWKEDGKATGAGTPIGWGRATDIVAGRSMSLSTVRRMFSFFSRHEVDKKGKDFNNTSNPSNGRIMWDAWGGDAGFSWSRAIVNRMKDKSLFAEFGKDYTKPTSISYLWKD